jgi:iron complex outermembrane receptor protein
LPAAIAANPNTNPSALSYNFDRNDNTAWAAFAQANYDLTDDIELSFALRYDRDEREQTIKTPAGFLPVFDGAGESGDVRSEDFDSWQPKFTARWKPSDDLMVYGTYAQGFRSGGFNLSGVAAGVEALRDAGVPGMPEAVEDQFDQEDSESIELGFKGTFFEGTVDLSVAVFHTTLDNAFTFTFVAPFTAQTIRNIEEAEIMGFELTAAWLPTDNLQFDVGLGIIDSEINDSTWTGVAGIDIEGNELPMNPENSFNLGVTWTATIGELDTFVRFDYERKGEMYFEAENISQRDALDLFNLRVGLSHEDSGWSVALWGRNLTDEDYLTEMLNPNGIGFFGPQRQYGLEIVKRF